ncbi:MazG-like family protein [Tepidimicrobium xylanilyticum]|uniref:MazG-like family protein n=2 Tax=Tepidimicrobium xylanilyticum TaxID=1123352 RepID=A0A1H3CCP7_9FIRM|nr:MazG-like family protein [Tepidimicrobium xylanilyticum]GMG98023.1 hypothetical protein EN5CB1_28490 [Tepidimicrobium xylanilyticum]SDX51927.1 MazG-like family protein [Tepidimicrobium xylanilyticum]
MDQNNMDIIKNLRTIEWLKSEILSNIAQIYQLLSKGEDYIKEDIEDLIANMILLSYLLGKRLGIGYEDISSNLIDKIKLNILEGHKIEKWYGDLNELLVFLKSNRN